MVSPRPEEIRRTLAERVARRVQGHGITRASVDAAVAKVLGALDASGEGTSPTSAAPADQPGIVATLSGRSVPDLASRVRAALEHEGVSVQTIGSAMAGNHNVVTLHVSSDARPAVERVARTLALSLAFVPAEPGR